MIHLMQNPPIVVLMVSFLATLAIGFYLRNRKLAREIRSLEIALLQTRLSHGRHNPIEVSGQRIA